MAFGQISKVEVTKEPLGEQNRKVTDDEEIVQIMWDAVRDTHSTDMEPLRFNSLNYALSYKWADALKDFVRLKLFSQLLRVDFL